MSDIYKGEIGDCPICNATDVEVCSGPACRDCHVSCSWEDCMDNSSNVATSLSVMDTPERREMLRKYYPNARQWR